MSARSPVLARMLWGIVLTVALLGAESLLSEVWRASRPAGERWQARADVEVREVAAELEALSPAQRDEALRSRVGSAAPDVQLLAPGALPEAWWERLLPGPPWASQTLSDGRVLWVSAPGWRRPPWWPPVLWWTLAVLGVGVVAVALSRPLARDLDRMRTAVALLASERLGTRVGPLQTEDARPLGEAIDAMSARLERMVDSQRQLLHAVSHELRTPHARLLFQVESLQTARTPEALDQLRESMEAELAEIDALLIEVLSFARIDLVELPQDEEAWEVADALAEVAQRAGEGPDAPAFTLDVDPELATPRVSRRWFVRAVGNLARNARRHAQQRVTIRAHGAARTLVVAVEDDGPGIPEAERARLIRPFEVGPSERGGHGVGLGLAVVDRILGRVGGRLEIDASDLGGARVTTTWPI